MIYAPYSDLTNKQRKLTSKRYPSTALEDFAFLTGTSGRVLGEQILDRTRFPSRIALDDTEAMNKMMRAKVKEIYLRKKTARDAR